MKHLAVAALLLFTLGCATMKSESGLGNARVDVVQPDVEVVQLSSIPSAARHVTGGIPVQYGIRVLNKANHPIVLKRATLVSMGDGAYNLGQVSQSFNVRIVPAEAGEVKFWAPANIENASIVGANGPVTLRATLTFDSEVGQFEKIVVQQVNAFTGVGGGVGH